MPRLPIASSLLRQEAHRGGAVAELSHTYLGMILPSMAALGSTRELQVQPFP